jgi:YfiH family protein
MNSCLFPDWPAPKQVIAFTTMRDTNIAELDLPSSPVYLKQVHGIEVVEISQASMEKPTGDASFTQHSDIVCVVKTADCLPLLVCDKKGKYVAAIHAGWRGLAAGVIENTLQKLPVPREDLLVWLGPAIGPKAFEVGEDVREKFSKDDNAFIKISLEKYLCNIYALAKNRLTAEGIEHIFGGNRCTYTETAHFYSYRRGNRESERERLLSLIFISL